ncbi:MAG: MerR family transcriptional regulator [Pseudomonadota bacterium]
MRIAEASAQSGLSIDTIRYYEKIGMLQPIGRGADGQRRFTAEDIQWMTQLNWLRQTGMPQADMRAFAVSVHSGTTDTSERYAILLRHRTVLAQRRRELEACERYLDHKLSVYAPQQEKTHG